MLAGVRSVLEQTLFLSLEAAPWILAGLLATALFRAFVNPADVVRSLGAPGFGSSVRAALFGAPLPMCSCGVLPAAFALHRGGASKGATSSFMVSVPETNPEAIIVSWGMLGPALAIIRPVTALVAAVTTGVLVDRYAASDPVKDKGGPDHQHAHDDCCSKDHCHGGADQEVVLAHTGSARPSRRARLREGLFYTFTDVIDGISTWIVVGLLVAGIITALLPPDFLGSIGSGPIAILVALVISVPLYVCASGSIPMGAALLFAGASPGVVLAFLLAGPSTNIATMGAIRQEMGARVMWIYTGTIAATAFVAGLMVDAAWPWIASFPDAVHAHVHIDGQVPAHGWIPLWLMWGSLIIVAAAAIKPVRRVILRPLTHQAPHAT